MKKMKWRGSHFVIIIISWGTKGDNGVAKDLGVVTKVSKEEGEVELELPTDPQDIENQYGAALMELERKVAPAEVRQKKKGKVTWIEYRSFCFSSQ